MAGEIRKVSTREGGARLQKELAAFLVAHADFPQADVPRAVADLEQWTVYRDDDGVAGVARWVKLDWYSCVLKNAATRPDLRGRGLASRIYKEAVDEALAKGCHVLTADITYDNKPSIRAAEKAGFKVVDRFCWAKGEKPAEILHLVRQRPDGDSCGALAGIGLGRREAQ